MYVNFLVHVIGDHGNDANILGRSVHTTKENTEALVIDSKETGHVSRSECRTKSRYKD